MSKFKKLTAIMAATAAMTIAGAATASDSTVLGELTAQGAVRITSLGVNFRVANTNYSLLNGDIVRTGKEAITNVHIDGVGSLSVAKATEFSVDNSSDVLEIRINSGAVQFAFNKDVDFKIIAQDRIVTRADSAYLKVSDGQIRGIVGFQDGQFFVSTESSELVVQTGDGQIQTVFGGEMYAAGKEESSLTKVQTGGVGTAAVGISPTAVLVGAAVVGATVVAGVVAAEDSPAPASASPAE